MKSAALRTFSIWFIQIWISLQIVLSGITLSTAGQYDFLQLFRNYIWINLCVLLFAICISPLFYGLAKFRPDLDDKIFRVFGFNRFGLSWWLKQISPLFLLTAIAIVKTFFVDSKRLEATSPEVLIFLRNFLLFYLLCFVVFVVVKTLIRPDISK